MANQPTQDEYNAMADDIDEDAGWHTVSEDEIDETKIVFETIGDKFVGIFRGTRVQNTEDGGYTQLRFTNASGKAFFTNANHSMLKGMETVKPGKMVRLVYVSDKDVGQKSPLRIFRVDVKR
jgi:hypothetical protein